MTHPVTWQTSRCLPTKEVCLLTRKKSIPTLHKEKENCGHQQNVCVLWQTNRSGMALCFVEGYSLENKENIPKVLRLKYLAEVSIKPPGTFHG